MADVVARGFAQGTQPIASRLNRLVQKTLAPVEPESVEQLSQRADDLWASHEAAMKRRPVS